MKELIFAALIALSSSAYASDSWDNCSDAAGTVKISFGTLTIGEGSDAIRMDSGFTRKVVSTVSDVSENCTLEGTNTEVVAYENKITVEEVTFPYPHAEEDLTTTVICEVGGSGIPAAASCQE